MKLIRVKRVDAKNLFSLSDSELSALKIDGAYQGDPGIFHNFKKKAGATITCSFSWEKRTPSGMRQTTKLQFNEGYTDLQNRAIRWPYGSPTF